MDGHALSYVAITVLTAGLTELTVVLAKGRLPSPHEPETYLPMLVAMLTALTTQLRQIPARDGGNDDGATGRGD